MNYQGVRVFLVLGILLRSIAPFAGEISIEVRPAARSDMESLRPLVEGCQDLGELEFLRSELDSVSDYEDLRSILERQGQTLFTGCEAGLKHSLGR